MTRRGSGFVSSLLRDAAFLWVIGGAVLLVLILLLVQFGGGSKDEALRDVAFEWTLSPRWEGEGELPAAATRVNVEHRSAVAIHLDLSYPMGGFLPPNGAADELSGFRAMTHLVADHLARVAGTTTEPVQWFGVGTSVVAIERPQVLHRALFRGAETRLDLSVASILQGLEDNTLGGAVLISDLIATEELVGPMGVAKALTDWLASDRVRQGELHLGLLGVRARYWGVGGGMCKNIGALGCWFSEQAQRWQPLSGVVDVPFYVLVFGRGQEPVEELGSTLLGAARELGLEARWELLSGATAVATAPGVCRAHKKDRPQEEQFALVRDDEGRVRCVRGEEVDLTCDLPSESQMVPLDTRSSWDAAVARLDDGALVITVDCTALRRSIPPQGLIAEVEGRAAKKATDEWEGWSSETDELEESLGRTLRLRHFVAAVRLAPARLVVTSSPILR